MSGMKLLKFIPRSYRARLIRRSLRLPYSLDKDLVFKIAENRNELEQAFRLLHDAYVDAGFMKPHPSGLRVTLYHALPSTTTLIAKYKGQVVGTVSIISRDVFRLPLESIFQIENVLPPVRRVVEISSLAVHKSFRKDKGSLFFALCKYLFHYATDYFHADNFIIAVNPKHVDLYQEVMQFKKIDTQIVESYGFANGAPAVGLYIDLKQAHNDLLLAYDKVPARSSLFNFMFMAKPFRQFHFPLRYFHNSTDPVLSAEDLKYFFTEKTKLFSEITPIEIINLRAVYASSLKHLEIIPNTNLVSIQKSNRQFSRHVVNFYASALNLSGRKVLPLKVVEVSESGIKLERMENDQFEWPATLSIRVQLGESKYTDLKIKQVWAGGHKAGYELTEPEVMWSQMITDLDRLLRAS